MNGRALGRRVFPYLVVFAFGFLLAYVLLFVFAFPSDVVPDDGRVPVVVGLPGAPATERTSDQPSGAVMDSGPVSGEAVPVPAEVRIAISRGPATLQVPDFTGQTVADARSTLEQLGLRLGVITRDTSSLQPENTILFQSPGPGQTVSAGGHVSLRISRFPPPSTIQRIDSGTPSIVQLVALPSRVAARRS